MTFLLLIGLFGLLTAGSTVAIPPVGKRKAVAMGDAEDPRSATSEKSKRMEKWLTETMALTDPEEVASRAYRLRVKYPQTAQIVLRRAKELQAAEGAAKAPEALYHAAKTKEPYPVFNLRWSRFLLSVVREISDVSNGHVGYFYFAWPRLVALKLATNLKKKGKTWKADFVEPPTLDEFLASSKLQYEAFVKSVLEYLPVLTSPSIQAFMGKVVNGKRVTLSGLIAVAHRAGLDGLRSWLSSPDDQLKYPNTTATFEKSTQIF